MAITTAICNSFKQEILQGIHQSTDTYKLALFTGAATLDKTVTAYSSSNEVSGTGYTAGGATLSGFASGLSGDVAYIDFDDPSWASSTITAYGALLYNATRGGKAVAVFDFGGPISSTAGTFTAQLPPPGLGAIVRVS